MSLILFFRLILMSIFQPVVTSGKTSFGDRPMSYDNQLFYCPRVFAKDGFNVSMQIHLGNYCESENGYRQFGHTMLEVEFGFPSEHEPLMSDYAEDTENTTQSVGKIPVSVMEEVFAKHGGIDWKKAISVEQFNRLVNIKE